MKKDNSHLWVIAAIVAILLLGIFGFRGTGYGMMPMMYGNYGTGMMFFGWIVGTLFLVVLVLLIVWLTKEIQKK